ncbi:Uncharacterized protein HZ326_6264 [Fusarium oxysporum f. sp. albedinis]|nr:Uncharacterized protein HZ326_6264 [Fusarium oxysporum f. sp. albedinis]
MSRSSSPPSLHHIAANDVLLILDESDLTWTSPCNPSMHQIVLPYSALPYEQRAVNQSINQFLGPIIFLGCLMSQSAPRPGGAVLSSDAPPCLSLTLKTFPDVVAAPLSLAPSIRTLRCIFRGRRTSIIHNLAFHYSYMPLLIRIGTKKGVAMMAVSWVPDAYDVYLGQAYKS